ncbi:MAG TPA: beta-N-acetylhexosaminidase [Terrimesophilobacter sp.]|uniref:beta-N-acetylhexosaminidase n=1 Tax=Terrimesophilobacter sp. TaxID=2906435 RepID=UPI002F93FDEB
MALGSRIGWYLLIAVGLATAQLATTAISAGTAPDAITITAPARTIVPAPDFRVNGAGAYLFTAGSAITAPSVAAPVAHYLQQLLGPLTGATVPLSPHGDVHLELDPGHPAGGYDLTVRPSGIWMTANDAAGLFDGVQTLRQLLPATAQHSIPAVASTTISDHPRFAYRGAMLDVARHFFGATEVKRYIDDLAMIKINVLHLHLSDDQGWRIAIDGWPRLTDVGGSSQVGGGGGGYYTQDEYRDIVAYAASRYITIVPEIDMPGHTNAALASYAELDCDGQARALYRGTNVGFSSLCVGKEITYSFVAEVIRQLAALTPGPWIHLGGDESSSTSRDDYIAFVNRASALVAGQGKTVIGWHDIGWASALPRGTVGEYWDFTTPRGASTVLAQRLIRGGGKLIMAPANVAYLDMEYYRGARLGTDWAQGPTTIQESYLWDPAKIIPGVGDDDILGVEAPLWSETFSTLDDLEWMAFPRIVSVAEIGWSMRATRNFAEFAPRLGAFGAYLSAAGVDYYRAPGVPWQ